MTGSGCRLWVFSFLAAFLFHGGILAGVALWRPGTDFAEPPAAAMQIELVPPAPAPVSLPAPASDAQEPPPPKAAAQNRPRPVSKPLPSPSPKPKANLAPASVAKPADGPAEESPVMPLPPAPQAAGAAPVSGAAAAHAARNAALSAWQTAIRLHLERRKRYPDQARVRRQEGEAMVRFTMTRDGRVTVAELVRGSGHAALDRETLALPERAQPLPPPPAEIAGDQIEIVVPIQFSLR